MNTDEAAFIGALACVCKRKRTEHRKVNRLQEDAEECGGWMRRTRQFSPCYFANKSIWCELNENLWPNTVTGQSETTSTDLLL